MFGGSKKGLEDELFNLKFVSKQLQRESKKAEKEMIKEKEKVKKALEQGKHDIAEIHAQNAIMQKNQTLNYLRMSSRIDAVAGKLGAAMKMQKVTSSMAQITKSMGKVLQTMKLDKIEAIMDKFEKVFEDADVMSAQVTGAMQSSTSMSTPQSEIEELLQQVADENQLDLGENMPQASKNVAKAGEQVQEEDELMRRLAQLKAPQ
uniref:Charged multivesicular body protein 1a n=1 Tax=Hanusia phi TaxID=3032 RepID=A0A7S0HT47_9CRYP